jgi:uncharacterized membrane protein YphA (DoxX/SURF4 family)
MAGGLLVLAAHGAGRFSLDALLARRATRNATTFAGAAR